MTADKVALVTGATGIQGRALVEILDHADKEWAAIYAVSRHSLQESAIDVKRTKHIRLDLNDKDAIKQVLKDDKIVDRKITHIFHLAFSNDTTNIDESVFEWLKNLVESTEAAGHPLQHVFYEEGIKYYGVHWGVPKTPSREDDARHLPPNFYYPAEDYLISRVASGAAWTWSSLRPNFIYGFSVRSKMNLLQVIAVYGAVCKELGIAMRFPGTAKTYYDTVQEAIDSKEVMHAAIFTSTHKGAVNNAYNVSNADFKVVDEFYHTISPGDTFRWAHLWPNIAEWFGNEAGPPLKVPLKTLMDHHKETWKAIQEKHQLKIRLPLPDIVDFESGDEMFSCDCDVFSDVIKLRQAGYKGMQLATDTMFYKWFNELADRGLIPKGPGYELGHKLPAANKSLVELQRRPKA